MLQWQIELSPGRSTPLGNVAHYHVRNGDVADCAAGRSHVDHCVLWDNKTRCALSRWDRHTCCVPLAEAVRQRNMEAAPNAPQQSNARLWVPGDDEDDYDEDDDEEQDGNGPPENAAPRTAQVLYEYEQQLRRLEDLRQRRHRQLTAQTQPRTQAPRPAAVHNTHMPHASTQRQAQANPQQRPQVSHQPRPQYPNGGLMTNAQASRALNILLNDYYNNLEEVLAQPVALPVARPTARPAYSQPAPVNQSAPNHHCACPRPQQAPPSRSVVINLSVTYDPVTHQVSVNQAPAAQSIQGYPHNHPAPNCCHNHQ